MSINEIPVWICIKCDGRIKSEIRPLLKCTCGGDVISERDYFNYHSYNKVHKPVIFSNKEKDNG